PATPEENEEQNQGRRALWEAFEEDARREVSGFQTGQITGLSDRRPQPHTTSKIPLVYWELDQPSYIAILTLVKYFNKTKSDSICRRIFG
ncbi:MAG: hypothetical protein NTV93_12470, partial [Verrucomicrobia bacterium]|nr:hypothetical protein [Verrucomicrobiota bacterium]